jgi:uncharacterized repeat protein (TIGR01451 family)
MKHLISLAILAILSLSGFSQETCNAYFNASPFQGSYYFYPSAFGQNYTYAWDFGDGTSSLEMNPVVEYIIPGLYTVCLHVSNEDLSCDETFCMDITVCPSYDTNDILVTALDDNTYSFENLNPEYDAIWYSFPGSWTSEDNPAQNDFIMSGTYDITAMLTGESYLFSWVDNQGNIQAYESYCMDSVSVSVDVDLVNYATISGYVFSDQNANGIMDSDEGPSPVYGSIIIESNGTTLYQNVDANGYFEAQVTPGNYIVASTTGAYFYYYYGITVPASMVQTSAYGAIEGYEFTVADGDDIQNLNFGVVSTVSLITGTVFGDENGNGIQESNEYGIPYHSIYVDGIYAGSTNSEGFYSINVSSSDHTVSIYYLGDITVPASGVYEINDPVLGQTFADFNFGITASGADLEVNLSWVTPHVPGTYRYIWVDSYNHGVSQNNVVTTLQLDPLVQFQSASAGGVYDELTHTITWTDNFSALSYKYYDASVFVSTEAQLGESVLYTATISGNLEDGDLSNNTTTHQSNVVASYDPNMKQVSPAGLDMEGFVEANENMQYTLHFQNTGSYYAMNVIITDELPQELDPSSIEVMSSSHPCTSSYVDGVLSFNFSDIMLPWQDMDDAASQGFVTFRINQDQDLEIGTTIENEVNIYFDFNEPVLTNTALNTISDSVNSVVDAMDKNFNFALSPVPADGYLNVSWENSAEKLSVRIVDLIGQEVLNTPAIPTNTRLDVQMLSSGIYTIQLLQQNQVLSTLSFVKR